MGRRSYEVHNEVKVKEQEIEIKSGDRFAFGANWAQFLTEINDDRIEKAQLSLQIMLDVDSLSGKSFLDIGSGSGLFSLAARLMGASVSSFDYDFQSVACTEMLKSNYCAKDSSWHVEQGSILDKDYMTGLGQFDVVYSWGVLHHTGNMWEALTNIVQLVKSGGKLFIAIYNDQGGASRRWKVLKKIYNKYSWSRKPLALYTLICQWKLSFLRDILHGEPLASWRDYKLERGMSPWRDVIDWIGGYPFEVAKPEEIFDFFREKGFTLVRLKTCAGGIGCNEFVFIKQPLDE